ncbi:MAG: SIS domain-containing protein [Sedimentisphaerales bacterium]|nr:SIS domain-containing protein [Sedimentisphaerales bacterium]
MNKETKKLITESVESHRKMTDEFLKSGIEKIAAISEIIIESLEHNGTIYICGNGGSAADAQHIASELVGRFQRERKGLAAVALTTDTSIMTSVANDYTFEHIFSRQVQALAEHGDILWTFSTSGTSPNILAAAKLAKEIGATVLAFTGRSGSELENIADICFCADSNTTARSQEIHQLAYHIICDLVEKHFTNN